MYQNSTVLAGWEDATIESLTPDFLITESLTSEDQNAYGSSKLTFVIPQNETSTVRLSYTLKNGAIKAINEIGGVSKLLRELSFRFSLIALGAEA